jgi:hypothetical protein
LAGGHAPLVCVMLGDQLGLSQLVAVNHRGDLA